MVSAGTGERIERQLAVLGVAAVAAVASYESLGSNCCDVESPCTRSG